MLNAAKQSHIPVAATPSTPTETPSTRPAADLTTFTERRVAAWVGKALRVEGRIISNEDLTIDGSVEGSIELGNHSLTIGEGAAVKADLTARTITISGTVTGAVRATEKIELQASAAVEGDISAPRFVMTEGATVRGRIEAGTRGK
jgi:cytoskeletal protein CcmA (bactofilin family)